MRTFDAEEAEKIKAEPWQIEAIQRNPSYVLWGPHEDYMAKDNAGWDGRKLFKTWSEFGPWSLDELNECVNFYFSIHRPNKECSVCHGNGYHRDAQDIVNSFYRHSSPNGEYWNDKITDDEVDVLFEKGRLHHFRDDHSKPTTAEVNAAQRERPGLLRQHDGINRMILVRTRLERLGIPVECDQCGGSGYVYTSDKALLSLTLWWLHPRKGCSRGIEIESIEQSELPMVLNFLRAAAARNAERFAKLSLALASA